jgi:hypothetical protein
MMLRDFCVDLEKLEMLGVPSDSDTIHNRAWPSSIREISEYLRTSKEAYGSQARRSLMKVQLTRRPGLA